ncbi:amino acid adenylation domain-containing protein [Nonomuraea sp. NPDC049400]|uniref:amino acid adenylation domain-containing protein n=1 Tax=Nonomuraea sp. NPDC049400 TaxID=3364352 RepID=UPI0037A28E96
MTDIDNALASLSDSQLDLLVRHLEPIAPNQLRLWIDHELDPDSNAYNVSRSLRLRGRLDAAALIEAVNTLVRRHEALRTVFLEHADTVYQLVLDPDPVLSGVEHVSGNVAALAREFMLEPFDLRRERPMRARLLRVSDDEHVLLLAFHHIAVDGWSLDIVERELAQAYESISRTGGWTAPAPAAQCGDFTRWQRQTLTPELVEAQLGYWRTALPADPAEGSSLATPSMVGAGAGPAATASFEPPPSCAAAIDALCGRFDVSAFAVLQAAVQILVWRYSGDADVVLGTTTLNRKRPEFESAVGFFVNTVALHTNLADNPSFGVALARARETVNGALSHDDVPFDRVVAQHRPGRRGALFHVAVELQSAPFSRRRWGGVTVEAESLADKQAKFGLTWFFLRTGDQLRLMVEYDTALFDQDWVEATADALFTLISAGEQAPDTPVADLDLLGERRTATMTGPPPRDAMPPTSDLIRALAGHGERIAVRTADDAITFTELSRLAEACAGALIERGLPAGSFIGLVADRSAHSIAALLGIWLARCAYVPIDPVLPKERNRHVLADAGVDVVLGPADFDAFGAHVIDFTKTDGPSGEPRRTQPQDVAYVIYTSGTTGAPKGTLITQANVLDFMAGLRETYGVRDWSDEVVSLNAPLIFDVTVQQVLALLNGATLAIVPASARLDPHKMIDYLAETGTTFLECIPSHLQVLVDAGLLTRRDLRLRWLVPGGEALPPALWQTLVEARHLRVFNAYGPTECTVNATCQPVDTTARRPSIGRPLPGVSLYVADDKRRLVPRGAIGELYIGGEGVALGYLGRPDLTAERFLNVPWGPSGEIVRVYRSGDKVRIAEGGVIEYLGRLDEQVKIRGNRVELGEITARLEAHPAVTKAVTILDTKNPQGPSLHAFVVPCREVDATELIGHLRRFLPEHMIPTWISHLSAIPVTVIGKVDHRALLDLCARERLSLPPAALVAPEPPADDLERRLVELWRDILGVPQAHARSHFFELGGHSLLAARLIARLRRELGAAATFASLDRCPTPRQLAAELRDTPMAPRTPTVGGHVIELATAADDKTPLFCLHPLGGDVHAYRELVDALPTAKTVYGVFDGLTNARTRTTWSTPEAMVRTYAEEIRPLVGGRGCHLIGWSLGGLLAHAVARELEEMGVPVRSVSIWDTGVAAEARRPAAPDFSTGALSVLSSLAPPRAALSKQERDRLRAEYRIHGDAYTGRDAGAWALDTAAALWGVRPDIEREALADRAAVASLHNWLFAGWRPGIVEAPLWVVWAGDSLDQQLVTKTDWNRHTRATVREDRVEGGHHEIIRQPIVTGLARDLADLVVGPERLG